MSHSTTSTTSYILTKYSRAYPTPATKTDADVEWQHFTNPVIRLVLDIVKKEGGELESYRVRVLWTLSSGATSDAMDVDQREIVFEDVDLLAFSPPTTYDGPIQNFAIHGLPLKAVYRDSVVGIRYMHPRTVAHDTAPSYRRFQVNFQQSADATSFINAIRHVCPCKANGPPQGLPTRSVTIDPGARSSQMPPPEIPAHQTKRSIRPSMTIQATSLSNINLGSSMLSPREPAARGLPPLDTSSQATIAHIKSMNVARSAIPETLHMNATTTPILSSSPSYAPTPELSVYPAISSSSNLLASSRSTNEDRAIAETLENVPNGSSLLQSETTSAPFNAIHCRSVQLSSSSDPFAAALPSYDLSGDATPAGIPARMHTTANASSHIAPTQGPSMTAYCVPTPASLPALQQPSNSHLSEPEMASTEMTNDFITALRNDTSLYKLSRSELESLIAVVIREPGFIDLVKKVDSLWRMKAFVEHSM